MSPHLRRKLLAFVVLIVGTFLALSAFVRGGPEDIMLATIVAVLTSGAVAAVIGDP